MGNPRKGWSEREGVKKVYVQLHDGMKLRRGFFEEISFFIGKNILKMNGCSDIPMSAIQLECSALYSSHHVWPQCSVYIVKQLYPALQILLEFASLHFSLFIVYCFFDILYKSYISLVL